MDQTLITLLKRKAQQYNHPDFIAKDPISVPHRFTEQQDIEIAGFFAALLAWGNRTSIINSCNKIMAMMGDQPYAFILAHQASDLKPMLQFAHRTFNATDLYYCIAFLQAHYRQYPSLEDAFVPHSTYTAADVGKALIHFHHYFFSLPEFPERTRKHIANPERKSACKRLNMYLRWMVRKDKMGVDFGLWKKLRPEHLICPLDVHVAHVAHRLGLIPSIKADWNNALLLTEQLRLIDKKDPSQFDYALFGLGAEERF
jgi:uncharacterized protein (TIGR02757 family)